MPTNRRIKLTWQVSRYYASTTDGNGIRVRITASDANLMPTKIFAYLMLPMRPGADERVGAFDHVCSAVDIEEYPEDEPLNHVRPAWFRLDYVDVLLRSREEVEDFIRDVADDVAALKTTLDVSDDLLPGGSAWIGTPPDDVVAPPPGG